LRFFLCFSFPSRLRFKGFPGATMRKSPGATTVNNSRIGFVPPLGQKPYRQQ
jgi:hypothetical protein